MKLIFVCLVASAAAVTFQAPADWETCKVSVGKKSVLTVNEENLRFPAWPDCHVKIYQTPQADTLYIRKENKQLWWETYGHHEAIGDGFYKWLPETNLEIAVTGDQITLKIGPNAHEGAYGLCYHQFASRDPPCVEAWGAGGGPPPL